MKNLLKLLLSLPIISTIGSTVSCTSLSDQIIGNSTGSAFVNTNDSNFNKIVENLQSNIIDGSQLTTQNTLNDVRAVIQNYAGSSANISIVGSTNAKLTQGTNIVIIGVHDVNDLNVSKNINIRVDGVKLYYQPQPLPVVTPTPDPTPTQPNIPVVTPTPDPTPTQPNIPVVTPTPDPTPTQPNIPVVTPTPPPTIVNSDIDIDALVRAAYPYLESAQWWGDGAVTTDGIIAELQNKLGSSVVVKAVWSGFKTTRGLVALLKVSVEQATNPTNKKEYDFHGRLKLVMIYGTVAKDPGGGGSTTSHKGSWQSTVRIGTTTYGQILDYIKYSVFTEIVDFVDIKFKDNKNLSDTVKQYPGYSNRTEFMNFRVIDKTDPTNSTSFDIGFYDCL